MLRDEIANIMAIIDGDTDKPIVKERVVRYALTDKILALIDGQRCRWTHNAEHYSNLYHTSCGKVLSEDSFDDRPFCPFCGKRIGVVE